MIDNRGVSPEPAGSSPDERARRALLRGTTNVAFLIDPDGTFGWLSPSAERVLGYRPDELVGQPILSLLAEEDLPTAAPLLQYGLSNPRQGGLAREDLGLALDLHMWHKAGHLVPLECSINNYLASPDVRAILVVARDVTRRRALDDALTALAEDATGHRALPELMRFLDVLLPGTASAVVAPGQVPRWTTQQVPGDLRSAEGPWDEVMAEGHDVVLEDLEQAVASGAIGDGLPSATATRPAGASPFPAVPGRPPPASSPTSPPTGRPSAAWWCGRAACASRSSDTGWPWPGWWRWPTPSSAVEPARRSGNGCSSSNGSRTGG